MGIEEVADDDHYTTATGKSPDTYIRWTENFCTNVVRFKEILQYPIIHGKSKISRKNYFENNIKMNGQYKKNIKQNNIILNLKRNHQNGQTSEVGP